MQNSKKNLICAWKLSLNKGNYALKIDDGRQTERQTVKVTYKGASLLKNSLNNQALSAQLTISLIG